MRNPSPSAKPLRKAVSPVRRSLEQASSRWWASSIPPLKKCLEGEITKVESEIKKFARKLSSETFVQNAPADVVAEHRQRQGDWINRLAELQRARTGLD